MSTTETNRAERLYTLFEEFRNAYAGEWERLERAERMYRGDHWHDVPRIDAREPRPALPVVQSTVESIRADLMDRLPEAVITADSEEYAEAAALLTAAIGENHRRGSFEKEYSLMLHDLLVGGYMVSETGFDPEGNGGLGMAFLRRADIHSILFDPLCPDIQDGRAVFKFAPYPMEWFKAHYPEAAARMQADSTVRRVEDDFLARDQSGTVLLIECWEREYDPVDNTYTVHMAKLAGREMLEDSRREKPRGYFAHGMYPFTVTPLFTRPGTALGFGYVDMFETQQRYADKLDQIVLKNALMASRNKLLITGASGFDPDDLRDWSKEVHEGDSLSGVTWFTTPPLPGYIISYAQSLREGIKEESGANEFSRGQTMGGVTAAAAIAALQEASGKRSRMVARIVHGAFEEAVRQEIEVEREFALFRRGVRLGGGAKTGYFSSDAMYVISGLNNRLPIEFAVSVKAQRENRFTVAAHNETVLQLVKLGMLAPDVGLELMMFDGKEQAISLMRERLAAVQRPAEGAAPQEG